MTGPILAAVGLAGAVGAVLRFAVDGAVADRIGRDFPFGTLAVNLSGAFVLGLLVGLGVHGDAYRVEGTGFLGGYTTFSTWAFESHRLGEDGRRGLAGVNFGVSLILGVLLTWGGRHLGSAM